jgi:hypothetical protein
MRLAAATVLCALSAASAWPATLRALGRLPPLRQVRVPLGDAWPWSSRTRPGVLLAQERGEDKEENRSGGIERMPPLTAPKEQPGGSTVEKLLLAVSRRALLGLLPMAAGGAWLKIYGESETSLALYDELDAAFRKATNRPPG